MIPKVSYTIWFSQRNGSTLLCQLLSSTGIAGKPGEHFHDIYQKEETILSHFGVSDYTSLQAQIWENASTPNGVLGLKVNAPMKENDPLIRELAKIPGGTTDNPSNLEVWENAFPNHKHIFLTRRNKVKQAVSWWKAIVTNEWHRKMGEKREYDPKEIIDQYNHDALKHLLLETGIRESKIQTLFDQGRITPLTIVYEDFIKNYEQTVNDVINFLGLSDESYSVKSPQYQKLADAISEEWMERFRVDLQKDWPNKVW
ncbi:MAG: Stf0 family sulfotransferase [Bacteroidota bacterium]